MSSDRDELVRCRVSTGGVYNRAYAGGLASALAFGLSAAATASAEPAA